VLAVVVGILAALALGAVFVSETIGLADAARAVRRGRRT
jgi:hypothetical protein